MKVFQQPSLVVPTGLALALAFWLVDAAVDALFFSEEGKGILHSLIDPEPMDMWMRACVSVLMIGFAIHARQLLRRQQLLSDELARERETLEKRVADATNELREQNVLLQGEVESRRRAEEELQRLAETDPLTGLYNRRKLLDEIRTLIARDRRYRAGLSLILCDIDNFKRINDTLGHDVGDTVLTRFSGLLLQNTREADTLARWGGEEFALLTICGERERADLVAGKLRRAIEQADFAPAGPVTASFGVAVLGENDNIETLMKRADQALYAAKIGGRNAVVLAA